MPLIDHLLKDIPTYLPDADVNVIRKAYAFSRDAHKGQRRLTGEEFVEHPVRVGILLAEKLHADIPTIAGGILHDVIEDTDKTEEDVVREFGREIADLVVGCTTLRKIHFRGIERYIESLRKLFVAMAKDIRVITIKFADRLDNLETLHVHPPEKALRIAKETLEIYAPIADRLGFGEMKGLLEDASFPYVYPKEYEKIKKVVTERLHEKEKVMRDVQRYVEHRLKGERIPFESIHGRTKRLYSLYQKVVRKSPDLTDIDAALENIYDLIAIRIIVDTVPQCYALLGLIHSFCTPLAGRIKDYIATPKVNGYQSLHTTVWCPLYPDRDPEIVEFQIRTRDMHDHAEYGPAVHWHYDEHGRAEKVKKNLGWVNELTKWKKELKENQQYLESLKLDVLQDRIFVRTPKGDWIDLPQGSTPVDFAYHVHSELGNKCVRVKVNGTAVPLDTELQNHDVIEIIIDKNRKGPDPKWLQFVKTNTARTKIRESTKVYLFDWLKKVVASKDDDTSKKIPKKKKKK